MLFILLSLLIAPSSAVAGTDLASPRLPLRIENPEGIALPNLNVTYRVSADRRWICPVPQSGMHMMGFCWKPVTVLPQRPGRRPAPVTRMTSADGKVLLPSFNHVELDPRLREARIEIEIAYTCLPDQSPAWTAIDPRTRAEKFHSPFKLSQADIETIPAEGLVIRFDSCQPNPK
jgi:hypothetical protein